MLTLKEINDNEENQNAAFKEWVMSEKFTLMGRNNTSDLIDYVAGLNMQIAELQSKLLRVEGE